MFEIHVTVAADQTVPEGWKVTLPKVELDEVDGLHLGGKKILTRWASEARRAIDIASSVHPYLRRKVECVILDERAP